MESGCLTPSSRFCWIRQLLFCAFAPIVFGLFGCTALRSVGSDATGPGFQSALFSSQAPPLVGTRWLLASFPRGSDTLPIPSDPIPFLLFEEEFLIFESGCNDVEAKYRVDSEQLTIEMGLLRGVGCDNVVSPEAIALESPFQSSLSTWEKYRIEGDTLFIKFSGGEIQFSRLIPTAPSLLNAFPFQDRKGQDNSQETQTVDGKLTLVDGCLRLLPPNIEDELGYLIIWRSDQALGLEDGVPVIYDTHGERVGDRLAIVGEQLALRGRAVEQDELARVTPAVWQIPSPAKCPGPYWLAQQIE